MQPTERIQAFLADFAAAHVSVSSTFKEDCDTSALFETWETLLDAIVQRHGAHGFTLSGAMFGSDPEHSPETRLGAEKRREGGYCVVAAEREAYPPFLEYRLEAVDDDWRIAGIDEYPDPPDSPAIAAALASHLLALPSFSSDVRPLRPQDREDPSTLFVEHDFTDDDGDDVEVRLRHVGGFSHGEVLAIGDFSDELDMVRPLLLRVRPGSATVDVVTAYDRCAGVRITLTDALVDTWVLAGSDLGTTFGVDAGNLAVVDAESAFRMTVRQKELAWQRFIPEPGPAQLLERDGTTLGVIASSGWGDGAYPAYWGLDRAGAAAQLVVDFGVVPGAAWAEAPIPDGQGQDDVELADEIPTRLEQLHNTASPTAELRDVDDEDRERLPHLFNVGRVAWDEGFEQEVSLVDAGAFATTGALVISDFSGELGASSPVHRAAPAADVHVQWLWTDAWGEQPSALRLSFSDAAPTQWRSAWEDHDLLEVASGVLAVLDLERARSLTVGDVRRELEAYDQSDEVVRFLRSDDGSPLGLVTTASLGICAAYCGLDAAGEMVQLVLDLGLVDNPPWSLEDDEEPSVTE